MLMSLDGLTIHNALGGFLESKKLLKRTMAYRPMLRLHLLPHFRYWMSLFPWRILSKSSRLSIRLGASLGRQNCAKGFANWIKLVQFFWDLRFAFFQINILLRSEICLCPNRYTGNHRRLEQISLWGSTKYGFVLNDFQLIVTLVSLRNLCQKRIQSNFSSCDLDHHKKSMICIFCVQSNYDWCLGGIYSIKRLPPNFPSDLDLRRNQTNLLKN